ncbi:Transient receptor potential channel pyrexia [Orchesella cincta]|uniref:Transient receptor potential channel pyrexia n=1 Tax=Orchesella cincta TaxID=48709 RepID=A0A1D2M818_ORCCI|nr:Transient receptor potential channel pyrexia [Orchesella cincta]
MLKSATKYKSFFTETLTTRSGNAGLGKHQVEQSHHLFRFSIPTKPRRGLFPRKNFKDFEEDTIHYIHEIAQSGNTEELEGVLKSGINPNITDHLGKTPLHYACAVECSCVTCVNDSEACTRLLVATHGIDVNAQDDNGNTPLHIAIEHQLARCVRYSYLLGRTSDSGEEPVGLLAKRLPDTMTYLLNECVFVDQYDPSNDKCVLKVDFRFFNTRRMLNAGANQGVSNSSLPAGVSPETLTLQVPTPSAAKCEIATGISSEVALILVSTLLLAAIELCKLVITPKLYLRGWVNYGTWIFIGLVLMTTVPNLDKQTSIGPYQYQAAALTVFLAWAFILQQISRFPSLGKYIEMFGQVLKSFGFFLLTFMSLFIAFALSFSILFPTNSAFTFFCYSVLKVFVMMVGEIDYQDMFYGDGTVVTGPLLGHLLYAVFVLVISIVLMNLVIGLTVKDIQELQAQGELRRTAKLILSLYHLESFIFSNRIPRKLGDKLKASISVLYPTKNMGVKD